MVRRHVYEGERCMHCGVNIYDQWIYGAEDESDCVDREPIIYSTETPQPGKGWHNRYLAGNSLYAQWDGERYDDGWPHERDADGWCRNCMAPPGCSHTRLVPKEDA